MDSAQILEHWRRQAREHTTRLDATTSTPTIKSLEIDAVARALAREGFVPERPCEGLEVGCGNGHNACALAERLPALRLLGVDFVEEMVGAARANAAATTDPARLRFELGDVRALEAVPGMRDDWDWVLSDRCLINLPSWEEQAPAIDALAARVRPGGLVLVIENFTGCFARQNDGRERLGLPRRVPREFNTFLDEGRFRERFERSLEILRVEDFASLHDIVLYVLLPAVCGGTIEYDHPLVHAATRLSLALAGSDPAPFGAFGQNRLYVGRRS